MVYNYAVLLIFREYSGVMNYIKWSKVKVGIFSRTDFFFIVSLRIKQVTCRSLQHYNCIPVYCICGFKLMHLNGCFSRLVQTRLCVYILINMVTKVKSLMCLKSFILSACCFSPIFELFFFFNFFLQPFQLNRKADILFFQTDQATMTKTTKYKT